MRGVGWGGTPPPPRPRPPNPQSFSPFSGAFSLHHINARSRSIEQPPQQQQQFSPLERTRQPANQPTSQPANTRPVTCQRFASGLWPRKFSCDIFTIVALLLTTYISDPCPPPGSFFACTPLPAKCSAAQADLDWPAHELHVTPATPAPHLSTLRRELRAMQPTINSGRPGAVGSKAVTGRGMQTTASGNTQTGGSKSQQSRARGGGTTRAQHVRSRVHNTARGLAVLSRPCQAGRLAGWLAEKRRSHKAWCWQRCRGSSA